MHSMAARADRIPVRVVLITMYELEGDDHPGEFQYFCEEENLSETYPLPAGAGNIWSNDRGLIGLVVGVGAARSASSTMALGLDPRFDLSRAYLLIAGICGINPRYGSIGSAVWGDYCVDGDLATSIDPRETPDDWPTGLFPLGSFKPNKPRECDPTSFFADDEVYALNLGLANWALERTRYIDLSDLDSAAMGAYRSRYRGFPHAMKPPEVLVGSNLGMTHYWHGAKNNTWAEDWVDLWTEGKGKFVTSTMEDHGTLRALTQLGQAGLIDWNRILLLRTASNYTMQAPDGQTALESLMGVGGGDETMFPGYAASLHSLQRTGSAIIREFTGSWDRYCEQVPGCGTVP